jgi:LmbE family N-acetylglucosaminyl deacetylase
LIQTLALSPADRVLVLAPHPDDESVATGGLLQHALEAGSRVAVVFFTDGDNNPWAQRASELRWPITAVDRARFAVRRRREALRALERLGLASESVRFLGFPDQGATDLLLHGNDVAMRALAEVLQEWRPTIVVGPSLLDLHPDHSALGVMLCLALENVSGTLAPRYHIRFLVHNPKLLARHEGALVLPLGDAQRTRKRAAIACHRTQLVLRSTWLFSFAKSEERFYLSESPTGEAFHPVRQARHDDSGLEIAIESRTLLRAFGSRTLCIAGGCEDAPIRLSLVVPSQAGRARVRDLRSGEPVGEVEFRGRGGRGSVTIPAALVPHGVRLFAKVERAFGFFDEAGWKELEAPARQERRPLTLDPGTG